MNDYLIINTNRSNFQAYTANGAGASTYAGDVPEGSESYQNYRKATEAVNMLRQAVPVDDRALKRALDNQETGLMVVLAEMKKNANYVDQNPHLIELLDEQALESLSFAVQKVAPDSKSGGTMKDNWKTIVDYVNGKLESDMTAADKYTAFQEDYLAWFALKGTLTQVHKNAKGDVDGQYVDCATLLTKLSILIDKYKNGSAGTLQTFTGPTAKQDALDWAKDNAGLPAADAKSGIARCVVESPAGSGIFKVKIDIKGLQNTQASLKEYQATQTKNGGSSDPKKGFFIDSQHSALENMLDTNQRGLDTQTTKTLTLVKTFKEEVDAVFLRLNDFLVDEAEWFKILNG